MENIMKNLFTLFAGLVLITNCASIGSVVEGTKEFTTGVVQKAANRIDEETDKLQSPQPEGK